MIFLREFSASICRSFIRRLYSITFLTADFRHSQNRSIRQLWNEDTNTCSFSGTGPYGRQATLGRDILISQLLNSSGAKTATRWRNGVGLLLDLQTTDGNPSSENLSVENRIESARVFCI